MQSSNNEVIFIEEKNNLRIILPSIFNAENLNNISSLIEKQISKTSCKSFMFDFTNVRMIDSSTSIYIIKKEHEHKNTQIIGLNDRLEIFYNLCKENFPQKAKQKSKENHSFLTFMYKIGEFSHYSLEMFFLFLSFLGEMFSAIFKNIKKPRKIRLRAISFHIEQNGVNALPIIAITSFLIGIVVAYQGAVLLIQFGANIFIVDFIGIAITRELAPLIVAIVIAGRSASAFTAEIGVMKITDEIDAMRTLGFSLWDFLILPRTYALIIALPLLVFFADVLSIFGGMIVASAQLDISYTEFLNRFQERVELKHIIIGIFKAPFFGFIIAFIGCFRGFQVYGNTQNVGKYTTLSVVNAIFWVIAFDALASVVFTKLGF